MTDRSNLQPALKTLAFYPRRPDGSSPSFCVADIGAAEAETLFVRQMFDTHDSAILVEVFEDDTLLRRYRREDFAVQSRQQVARPQRRMELGGSNLG
jgi:hypothetical protein